ncbi:MAG: hypothetical protein ACXQTF_02160 [Candidatus Hecatellaceae archaeon]
MNGKSSTSIRSEAFKACKALALSLHTAKKSTKTMARSTIKAANCKLPVLQQLIYA